MNQLIVYTDGSARGNPGPGGYGILLKWGEAFKEISGAFRKTTNNRMELMAVIVALQSLKREGLSIVIYSDSSYVVHAVEKGWLRNWLRTGFKGKKNSDLWQQYAQLSRQHQVRFQWVKGHADNPYNNRCDMLATMAADHGPWAIDYAYENGLAG